MKTVICYSVQNEIRFLKHNTNFDLVKIGVGKKRTLKNLRKIINKYDKFILIGFCGAVREGLNVGDVINFGRVCLDEIPSDLVFDFNKKNILCTVDKVFNKSDKENLSKKDVLIDAVDMESYYFVKTILENNKKCEVIKVVSDTKKSVLPQEIYIRKYFREFKPQIIFDFFAHPIEVSRLIRLKFNCLKAARMLNANLIGLV